MAQSPENVTRPHPGKPPADSVAMASPEKTPPVNPALPFSPPSIGEEEIAAVVATLRSGWVTTGPQCRELEKGMAAFLGQHDALAVNSCTAALHLALAVSGIGPGDEVVTTPFTFAATANVIEHLGARVVFADVEPDTLNIDPVLVERAVTPRTRALVPVHYAGHPAELDALYEIAGHNRLVLLEDAAHALPARYRGRLIGAGVNPVAFSFYATKNLTTIEGGLLTADPAFLERARPMSLHGMSRDGWKRYDGSGTWAYEITAPGYKYNLTDVAAAIGLVQLRRLPIFQKRRARIAALYANGFKDLEAIECPTVRSHVEHAWHLYPLRLRPEMLRIGRDRFIEELKARGIGTSVHFIPLHIQPYYRDRYGWKPDDFPVAYTNYLRILSLPLHPLLADSDVTRVIETVRDLVIRNQR